MLEQELAEKPLVAAGVLPEGFVDSWALNLYHDGSEGIQPHLVISLSQLPRSGSAHTQHIAIAPS